MAEEDAVCDVIILPIVPPMISQRPDGRILEDQRRFQTARLLLVVRIEHGPPNRRARRQTIAGFVVNPGKSVQFDELAFVPAQTTFISG